MSLLQRIKDRFTAVPDGAPQIDHSPALESGAVKDILVAAAGEYLPGFSFLAYRNGTYFFLRMRNAAGHPVHELLHLVFSLKGGNFACSVASRLNPDFRFSSNYNPGLVNPHQDLKVLRHGKGGLAQREAYYWHSGRIAGTAGTVREIFDDYRRYGLPFLDRQWDQVQRHPLLQAGFTYLDGLRVDRAALHAELEAQIKAGELQLSQLQHPVYLELKASLTGEPGVPKADRSLIALTAFELLQWHSRPATIS